MPRLVMPLLARALVMAMALATRGPFIVEKMAQLHRHPCVGVTLRSQRCCSQYAKRVQTLGGSSTSAVTVVFSNGPRPAPTVLMVAATMMLVALETVVRVSARSASLAQKVKPGLATLAVASSVGRLDIGRVIVQVITAIGIRRVDQLVGALVSLAAVRARAAVAMIVSSADRAAIGPAVVRTGKCGHSGFW